MSQVDVDAVMAGLKGFQRSAVDHVIDRFYGAGRSGGSGRFLVADETGLGKSIVARGVIARAIEHLETDDSVDRIDVVYVCSNRDLAQQNLRRLNVTGDDHIGMATRLSLLARDSKRLAQPAPDGRKRVNLVSFTPGTSFKDGGWQTGSAPERAMLAVILDRLVNETASDRRVTRLILQGTVSSPERFDSRHVEPLARELGDDLDERIVGAFRRAIGADGSLAQFLDLRDDARHARRLDPDLRSRAVHLTGRLRRTLAKAGVDALEPDLIILDEFQRFRNLLDPGSGEAAELAHSLFNHGEAKVLLLSATPYKPYTRADEDEDHYSDFLSTVTFLAGGGEHAAEPAARALREYRRALVTGDDAGPAAQGVREALLPLMSRSERPQLADEHDLLHVRSLDGGVPTPEDLADWAALQAMGDVLGTAIDLEYWKSIPYFASFMEGYRPAERARELLKGDDGEAVARVLSAARTIDRADVESYRPIDLGNGYLRALCRETVDAGWWRLLWLPPTMPYLEPGPVYRKYHDADLTKRVIFSAWSGVPTAVASLLSYDADRRIAESSSALGSNTAEARKSISPRLSYTLRDGQASAMSALALFWPHPALAALGDPLAAARGLGRRASALEAETRVGVPLRDDAATGPRSAWESYFGTPGGLPDALVGAPAATLVAGLRHDDEESGLGIGLLEHVRTALSSPPVDAFGHDDDVAALAVHAPGNIALRALGTVAGPLATERGLWAAAMLLANGIRALFNRPETMALLAGLYGDDRDRPYWRSVLAYCADGNLQAVLDEYAFQLLGELGGGNLDDDALGQLAEAAAAAMEIRPARYVAYDATRDRAEIPFRARFALRYGGTNASDSDDASGARQAEVRAAFNSPFAPFVLASTSVGQEGIDFHWWSHSVLHWNLPSNPVDFEQREGRVNRFAGHAVRKNVVAAHWGDVVGSAASGDRGPWAVAFRAAAAGARSCGASGSVELGEFSPWWVYPGPARIERVVAGYPLSRDHARYERLREALTLYRLTLGQPRQEDMVELLRRGGGGRDVPTIDLRPRRLP